MESKVGKRDGTIVGLLVGERVDSDGGAGVGTAVGMVVDPYEVMVSWK